MLQLPYTYAEMVGGLVVKALLVNLLLPREGFSPGFSPGGGKIACVHVSNSVGTICSL